MCDRSTTSSNETVTTEAQFVPSLQLGVMPLTITGLMLTI
jgi:hypothetical protein